MALRTIVVRRESSYCRLQIAVDAPRARSNAIARRARRRAMPMPPDDARARESRSDALRPLHHPLAPCSIAEFERATGRDVLACVLRRDARASVAEALARMQCDELRAMCDALSLRKSGTKAALVEAIVGQMGRGFARGTTRRGDAARATLARMRDGAFGDAFVCVKAGEEESFATASDQASAGRVWRERYALANSSVDGYYATETSRAERAYLLYDAVYEELPLSKRQWIDAIDCPMLPPARFCGEGHWSNDPRANARAMDRLYVAFGQQSPVDQVHSLTPDRIHGEVRSALAYVRAPENASMFPYWRSKPKCAQSEDRRATGSTATAPPATGATPTAGPPPTADENAGMENLSREMFRREVMARASPMKAAQKVSSSPEARANAPSKAAATLPGTTPEERTFYQRLEKADPMFEMISSADNPSYPPGDLVKPQKVVPMKTFQQCFFLSATDLHFLQREDEFELQAVCMLQNDDVKERMQWPLDVYLTANDHTLTVVKRSTVKSVTKSTRDPSVRIPASRLRSGSNHFRMFHRDRRGAFMVALRIVRKRTLEEVAACIPKAASVGVALRNALKHLGFTEKDDEVIMEDVALVSLRCPISGQVCRNPARLSSCVGLHTFDAESFLQLNTVSRKWCCPECGKKGGPSDLRVDSFIKSCVDKVTERALSKVSRIEINKDGHWRPREDAGAPPLDASQLRWYAPVISGYSVTWKLDGDDGSPTSTATKVNGVNGAETPNVESKETIELVKTDDDGEDSELDEEEEYRRAIREAAEFCGASGARAPGKKKREPDVIVISDSEDDNPVQRSAATQSTTKRPKPSSALTARPPGVPLSVDPLSPRSRAREVHFRMTNRPNPFNPTSTAPRNL